MKHIYLIPALFSIMAFTACTDDDNLDVHLPEAEYGTPNEWYYAGGKLGTTSIQSAYAYRQATQAVACMEELLGGKTYEAGSQSVYVDYVKVTPDNVKDFQ